ncbi:ASC1-like protein 3 [Capsicum annuum]|nr:ASC1-like protein 3 [Capsicum annuum]KAF3651763.1 ASC1-like protein 3 [Capsicum annuum]
MCNFFRIGIAILALHDASDVFMEDAKLFKYSWKEVGASILFGCFAVSWLVLRLFFFLFWVIRSSSYYLCEVLKLSEAYDTMLYYFFNTMLLTLLMFHIYWSVLIYSIIRRQLNNRGQVGEDVRSEAHSKIVDVYILMFDSENWYELFFTELLSLVQSGEILMTRIDNDVERILRVKFVIGLFEHSLTDRSLIDLVGCKIRPQKKILVVGNHADDLAYQCGEWTAIWTGLSGRISVASVGLDALLVPHGIVLRVFPPLIIEGPAIQPGN